jgi:hypothetical protein
MTAPRKRRKRRTLIWLLVPTVLMAALFAYVADHPLAAGVVGAVVGLFIGIALLAFPNLDRGGPADTDDIILH